MSRVLFDVNVPRSATRFLTKHAVAFADQLGWRELANGELLSVAERDGFEVMLTADRNLRYQQNLLGRRIAIVALSTNALPVIRGEAEAIVRAIEAAAPGTYQEVAMAVAAKRRRPPPAPN